MISSRFSKKYDQIPETGLNNSESNETPAKNDNNLSPHSQLVQRGVYLANSQPRNTNYNSNNNGVEAAKRSQEIRDHAAQYRERAVDVGQTAGISQQLSVAGNDCAPSSSKQYYDCSTRAASRQSVLDNETPNRYREMEQQNSARRYEQQIPNGNAMRRRFQNGPCDMPSTSGIFKFEYNGFSTSKNYNLNFVTCSRYPISIQ